MKGFLEIGQVCLKFRHWAKLVREVSCYIPTFILFSFLLSKPLNTFFDITSTILISSVKINFKYGDRAVITNRLTPHS